MLKSELKKPELAVIPIVLMFFLIGISQSQGEEITISGSIKTAQGSPIEGARLTLVKQNLSGFSNALGQYSLKSPSTGLLKPKKLLDANINPYYPFSPGYWVLSQIPGELRPIELYSLNGEKINNRQKGRHAFSIVASSATLENNLRNSNLPIRASYLAKSTAVTAVDSLLATAKGCDSKIVPVNGYVSLIDIVLNPVAAYPGKAIIDAVYFGQTHVLEPKNALFKLVGNRETLVKAHVLSPIQSLAPQVYAVLSLKEKILNLKLNGPDTLPVTIPNTPGVVQHSYKNSFTAFIPKEWVSPGLKVSIVAASSVLTFDSLKFGAPTEVPMTMFDIHFFNKTKDDYPKGWLEEIEAKWPVSKINLQRLPDIIFKDLVIPARGTAPAVRISSKLEYFEKTGLKFDGEQAAALMWNGALRMAAGISGRMRLHFINIYGAGAGGQGGGFGGVGAVFSEGILHHELGHALSLPHWGDNAAYPYKGPLFGILAPSNYMGTHAGPTWAFDLPTRTFIPPTVQPNSTGGVFGTYKMDPMQGGGVGDQEKGFIFRHFSDYSVNKMQGYLEGHVVVWNESLKSYAKWNTVTSDYNSLIPNDGVQFPILRNVQVYSIMAGVSAVSPQSNLIYQPIGPYEAGLIRLFDPTIAVDRIKADSIYCPLGGCDISLRVMQGGKSKTYLLPIALDSTVSPLAANSHITRAINLSVSDGMVTNVEMLATPNAEKNGLPPLPLVLDIWKN